MKGADKQNAIDRFRRDRNSTDRPSTNAGRFRHRKTTRRRLFRRRFSTANDRQLEDGNSRLGGDARQNRHGGKIRHTKNAARSRRSRQKYFASIAVGGGDACQRNRQHSREPTLLGGSTDAFLANAHANRHARRKRLLNGIERRDSFVAVEIEKLNRLSGRRRGF